MTVKFSKYLSLFSESLLYLTCSYHVNNPSRSYHGKFSGMYFGITWLSKTLLMANFFFNNYVNDYIQRYKVLKKLISLFEIV